MITPIEAQNMIYFTAFMMMTFTAVTSAALYRAGNVGLSIALTIIGAVLTAEFLYI